MGIDVQPATAARFDDVAAMLGLKNPASSVCGCRSYRLDSGTNRPCSVPPVATTSGRCANVLSPPACSAYEDRVAVGWAARRTARNSRSPSREDPPRRRTAGVVGGASATEGGVSHALLGRGRVHARSQGHRRSRAIRWTTRSAREPHHGLRRCPAGCSKAGFTKAADTDSVSGGFRGS